jgi:mRNA-degrading endonuclease RelE of RelBE toxin-antitoxin system
MMYRVSLVKDDNLKQELKALKKAGVFNEFEKKTQGILKSNPLGGKPLTKDLKGKGLYRYKLLKDWRIIYYIDTREKEVKILSVDNRKRVYDDPSDILKRLDNC